MVPLQGRGDQTGLNVDTSIAGTAKADVLLVIDDSCSMADKQTQLAQNMASFLQYATSNTVDFHLAVTNTELTDPDHGKFCTASGSTTNACPHGNKILRPNTPNLQTEFASLVRVGTHGYSESCMVPAARALTGPFITDPSINGGFFRPDAVLAMVCVTDTRDQAPQSPAFYLNQLINIKGGQRANQFSYNVIGPFLPQNPSGCQYDDPNDARHDFMVTQTNGVKEEICSPNWATALVSIGTRAFGVGVSSLFLTARPDLAATMGIVVAVNGVTVPATDPITMAQYWEYDPTANSVNFQPFALPPAGATVSISYVAPCFP